LREQSGVHRGRRGRQSRRSLPPPDAKQDRVGPLLLARWPRIPTKQREWRRELRLSLNQRMMKSAPRRLVEASGPLQAPAAREPSTCQRAILNLLPVTAGGVAGPQRMLHFLLGALRARSRREPLVKKKSLRLHLTLGRTSQMLRDTKAAAPQGSSLVGLLVQRTRLQCVVGALCRFQSVQKQHGTLHLRP